MEAAARISGVAVVTAVAVPASAAVAAVHALEAAVVALALVAVVAGTSKAVILVHAGPAEASTAASATRDADTAMGIITIAVDAAGEDTPTTTPAITTAVRTATTAIGSTAGRLLPAAGTGGAAMRTAHSEA